MITILWLCLHPNTLASTYTIMHLSLDVVTVFYFPKILICIVITIWHWYSWYWSLILSRWVTHYLALTLINKTNQAWITWGDCSRRNSGRYAWKGDPFGFGCHTRSCYLCALLLLHVTWYLSTVNYFSLLLGSTNASLVWYVVVLYDGAQDGYIRVIKHTRWH